MLSFYQALSRSLERTKCQCCEPDKDIKIDKIGQPRGIPNKFKAQSEIAAGFEALLPAIGIPQKCGMDQLHFLQSSKVYQLHG